MSVKYIPVQWTSNKWFYDAVLVAVVAAYIWMFIRVGNGAADLTRPVDGATVRMRAFGTCAFFMLTFILAIGPLARLDRRWLPLLYNRRHFGVITAVVAATHASFVMGWYYAFSPTDAYEALLVSNLAFDTIVGFPFETLGVLALLILTILAATSHDFWLWFLTPPVWKALHLTIYVAYFAVVAHIALGYLQDVEHPAFPLMYGACALAVAGLHVAAWATGREGTAASPAREGTASSGREGAASTGREGAAVGEWVRVAAAADIPDQRAVIVALGGDERAAVFRDGVSLSAVSNACAHQNGPLGEGRIVDGCITCPWHGFQYRMQDGCSPAPFTEKIPTYRLKLHDGVVYIDRRANPPGTPVAPVLLEAAE